MSRSQFAVYQLKKKPELRNLLFRTYEELAQDQIPVQVEIGRASCRERV